MSGILVLALRFLLAACLYAFLGWALYTIWRELNVHTQHLGSRKVPELTITLLDADNETPRRYIIPDIFIGRDPACECPIAHETISAHHARLNYHHNQWWVEDLASTNGTFINDERVLTPTVLISGDELRCGQFNLLITIQPAH